MDVPVGWPAPFRALLAGACDPDGGALGAGGPAWRREMTLRETDHAVTARTGLRPLSVAADRIAHPALRWAALASDDVLDAVIAALSAAWAAGGAARGPAPGRQRELAAAEGWIWLPETDGAGRSR